MDCACEHAQPFRRNSIATAKRASSLSRYPFPAFTAIASLHPILIASRWAWSGRGREAAAEKVNFELPAFSAQLVFGHVLAQGLYREDVTRTTPISGRYRSWPVREARGGGKGEFRAYQTS